MIFFASSAASPPARRQASAFSSRARHTSRASLSSVVILRVVIAIRHAESALIRLRDVIALFLSSWPEVKPKSASTPMLCRCAISFSTSCRSFIASMCSNSSGSGVVPRGVDCFFIHSAGVKVSDLLSPAQASGRLASWRFFRDRVQRVIIAFDQFVEGSPARIFRWNRRPLDPAAIGVMKKSSPGLTDESIFFGSSGGGFCAACPSGRSNRGKRTKN